MQRPGRGCDLPVSQFGTRGHTGAARAVVGSVADGIVRSAAVPVMLLRSVRKTVTKRPKTCRGEARAFVHGRARLVIRVKRVYEAPEPGDGTRIVVERLWPGGVRKDAFDLHAWLKDKGAPTTELRRWFGHDPARWEEFRKRYHNELDARPDAWHEILIAARSRPVTLLFSARDTSHSNAVTLKSYLETQTGRRMTTASAAPSGPTEAA